MTLETRDQNLLKTFCKMTFSMKFSLKFGISLLIVKSKSLMTIGCDNRKSELKVEQNFRRKFAPKIKAQKEPKWRFIFQELKVTIRF